MNRSQNNPHSGPQNDRQNDTGRSSKKTNLDGLGEYVDYEEIKD